MNPSFLPYNRDKKGAVSTPHPVKITIAIFAGVKFGKGNTTWLDGKTPSHLISALHFKKVKSTRPSSSCILASPWPLFYIRIFILLMLGLLVNNENYQ